MNKETVQAVLWWVGLAIALLAIGPILGAFAAGFHSPTGATEVTALTASAWPLALLITIAAVLVSGIFARIASPLIGPRLGLALGGVTIAWCAHEFGRVEEVLRDAGNPRPLMLNAIEGGIVMVLACGAAYAIFATTSSSIRAVGPAKATGPKATEFAGKLLSSDAAICVAATAGAGWFAALAVARTDEFGQTLAAAIIAGAIGSAIGKSFAPTAPTLACFIGMALLAVIAPLWAFTNAPADDTAFLAVVFGDALLAPARIPPLLWASGAMIGVMMGEGWAESVMKPAKASQARAAHAKA